MEQLVLNRSGGQACLGGGLFWGGLLGGSRRGGLGCLLLDDALVLEVLERLDNGEVLLVFVIQDETLLQSHAPTVHLALPEGGFPDCGVVNEAALASFPTRASG